MKKEPWMRKLRYKRQNDIFVDDVLSNLSIVFIVFIIYKRLRIMIFMVLPDGNIEIAFSVNIHITTSFDKLSL